MGDKILSPFKRLGRDQSFPGMMQRAISGKLVIELTNVIWQQKAATSCGWEQVCTLVWE